MTTLKGIREKLMILQEKKGSREVRWPRVCKSGGGHPEFPTTAGFLACLERLMDGKGTPKKSKT